jgi:hypothetical protein
MTPDFDDPLIVEILHAVTEDRDGRIYYLFEDEARDFCDLLEQTFGWSDEEAWEYLDSLLMASDYDAPLIDDE